MNILEQALNKIKSSKPQKNFSITLILAMIRIIGKRTYPNYEEMRNFASINH